MLIATWIITFVLIVGIGVYAGTKITNSGQWSGSDVPWVSLLWVLCWVLGRSVV